MHNIDHLNNIESLFAKIHFAGVTNNSLTSLQVGFIKVAICNVHGITRQINPDDLTAVACQNCGKATGQASDIKGSMI